MIKCLILDLDGTIVDTSILSELREQGRWKEVYENIKSCNLYRDVAGLIKIARSAGIKICIFTNSPSRYAQLLLKHFEIKFDYIVAYHDVKSHKPDSEGVQKILERFKFDRSEAVYLGDSDDDYLAASAAGIQFFSVSWGTVNSIPKCYVGVKSLLEFIGHNLASRADSSHPTKLLSFNKHFFLGYYLPGIKEEVWSFKDAKQSAIDRWVSKCVETANELPSVDFIVRALGHEEIEVDPFSSTSPLDNLGDALAEVLDASYRPDLIKKSRRLEKSTGLKAWEREQQVTGSHQSKPSSIQPVNGLELTILIIDDVYTTGATTRDISRALRSNYPNARIYIFTLTKTIFRDGNESREFSHNAQLFNDLYRVSVEGQNGLNRMRQQQRSLTSKQLTANYAHTNHNFVIQNLPSISIAAESGTNSVLDAVNVLKNMLQRGKPTVASRQLREAFGINLQDKSITSIAEPLISSKPIEWRRLIRGNTSKGFNPAKHFFDNLILKYFGEYSFVKQLTLPEVQILEMTQVYVEQFNNRQVDFYIPQVGLIIEIDGKQHLDTGDIDYIRDEYAKTLGLKTVRFSTDEVLAENKSFRDKISEIIQHIKMVDDLEQRGILLPPNRLTLRDYSRAYTQGIDRSNKSIRLCAAIRLQLTILELIESGQIRLNEDRTIYLHNRDSIDFAEAAIKDLASQLTELMILQGNKSAGLSVDIKEVSAEELETLSGEILIDFSVFERFSDEFQTNHKTIYVRTHYMDFYRYFESGDSQSQESYSLVDYDFFEISCSKSVKYNLDLSPGSRQRGALKFFLCNLFFPYKESIDFREGQIGIIGSALAGKGTIGLLPTGSGKSVCYQLAAILQPAISFVVCPIKSLMYDQKVDLDTIGFTRSNFITGDLKPDQKAAIQRDYGNGKYFFVFVSPERFQTHNFRKEMTAIAMDRALAYAVIDEVHCLSEWGHDFRTSYLNLANTIEKLAPESCYIGLTATASVNVLKDIQTEFGIPDDNVRTPIDFTRKELSFHVQDDNGRKMQALLSLVREMEEKWNFPIEPNSKSKAGIIFTPNVNGAKGCFEVAGKVSSALDMDVRYFSGSPPRRVSIGNSEFDEYKKNVQDDFKKNKYRLLAATKAFGMGVNKANIAYTIHFGIPGSMEALYQEAGRAGRDKKLFESVAADCYVLLSKENNIEALDTIWSANTKVSELKECVKQLSRESDVKTNLWLMTNGLDTINDEYQLILAVYHVLIRSCTENKLVITASQFNTVKPKLEKAIYRLSQIGIIEDWIIEDFFNGKFEVEFNCLDEKHLTQNLEATIQKYEADFKYADVFENDSEYYRLLCKRLDEGLIDKVQFLFLVLLLWSYDHFVYNRRQSLKTVYEHCSDLSLGEIDEKEFKDRLEGYFKFNESSQLLKHLAENNADIDNWLDVLFEEDDEGEGKRIISNDKLSIIRDQLSRFLESYKDNICLNYLSGVIRLINDQFDDADGERRMSSTLERLKSYDDHDIKKLLRNTLRLKPLFSLESQTRFARLFHDKFPKEEHLLLINEKFGDPYSYSTLLEPIVSQLSTVTKTYKDIQWKTTSQN